MKIIGAIFIIIALIAAVPAVKAAVSLGFGDTTGEQTRMVVRLIIPAVVLVTGIFLMVPLKK